MLFNKKPGEDFVHDHASKPTLVEMPAAPRKHANGAPTRSVIDSWLTIKGNLQSEGEVQVDGQIDGDIRCTHLTVGKDATVTGNIVAEEVVVRGKVKGTIRANRVIVQDSARVDSQIFHKTLAIEEGAMFDGSSCRRDDPMNTEVVDLQAAATGMKASIAA